MQPISKTKATKKSWYKNESKHYELLSNLANIAKSANGTPFKRRNNNNNNNKGQHQIITKTKIKAKTTTITTI